MKKRSRHNSHPDLNGLSIDDESQIVLIGPRSEGTRIMAGEELQRFLKERYGLDLRMVGPGRARRKQRVVLGTLDDLGWSDHWWEPVRRLNWLRTC